MATQITFRNAASPQVKDYRIYRIAKALLLTTVSANGEEVTHQDEIKVLTEMRKGFWESTKQLKGLHRVHWETAELSQERAEIICDKLRPKVLSLS